MPHRDFEKYALETSMKGKIPNVFFDFFKKYVDYKNNKLKVLDFGCGDGKYFPFFKQYFQENNIFGAEISDIRVKRCKDEGWKNVQRIDPLKKLPFEDNFFDLINFDQVIEHIKPKETHFYLSEIKRILKPEGIMILTTPNYPIKRMYDILNVVIKRDFKKVKDDPTHVSFYNFKKLREVLKIFSRVTLFPTGGFIYKKIPIDFFSNKIIGICKK